MKYERVVFQIPSASSTFITNGTYKRRASVIPPHRSALFIGDRGRKL
jgi:hypothetical protein